MRIGVSCNRFGAGGGLERYPLDIVGALSGRPGIAVDVFARVFDVGRANALGVDARRIDVSWMPGKLRDRAFSWALRSRRASCDVLIGCNRVRGAEIAICGGTHRGYLAARNRRPGMFDRWQIRLESDQYAGAAKVVAHSRLMQTELRQLYDVPESRIAMLYPPVDTRRFAPVDEAARRALRASFGFGDEIVFLFPSSSHARKGLGLLTSAFAQSTLPITLAVAGRPVGRALPQVRELGYRENIEDLYRAADFTALASDYEPFGLVGVESVLCGTPLVFADNIGCLEVIDPRAVESFSRARPDSLGLALERAVARVRSGNGRLPDPAAMLGYDPDVSAHAEVLLALCRTISADAPGGRVKASAVRVE